ncbi:Methionine aminopeptidase [Desulfurella amilsii]|uniref:Methionine aminopeptidase n=1 Tax=Desulfurella amilsii TaxID=1562698 RepID=A0A1X4XWT9_9BACT|nr:type I methionyl aminopeptidase [Desulfurella amilsii]OSS42001.1 Methionine aminopeptidase [Desulfurella amilsii]
MIILKSKQEIKKMRVVNAMVAEVLNMLKNEVRPGITTYDLDRFAMAYSDKLGAKPVFLGYGGFPNALCVSVNEEVVHGIPSKKKILKEGDIVSLDFGLFYDGFCGDSAITVGVGSISKAKQKLIDVTRNSLYKGIEQAKVGNYLFDISRAIQIYVESQGFSVVRDYVGHGIGKNLHEEPQVPNYVPEKGFNILLKVGMTIAIEPMVNMGSYEIEAKKDGWCVVTKDRMPSAHFEHTIAILEDGPVILSKEN